MQYGDSRKLNFKFLANSSHILFISDNYIMQNFGNFEKSSEGATSM